MKGGIISKGAHVSLKSPEPKEFSYKNWVSSSEEAWGKTCKTAGDASHCLPYSLRQWRNSGNSAALGAPQRVTFLYPAASGSIAGVDAAIVCFSPTVPFYSRPQHLF